MKTLMNIYLMIPLTCCVNCVGCITGNAPIAESKRDADPPAEMVVSCMGGMQEGLNAGCRKTGSTLIF